jgi:hypothetical protein
VLPKHGAVMNFEFAEEENTVAELARQVLEDRVTN